MATKKQAPKKRRGPAPRGDYAGKAKTINTRVTPDLRNWLEMAAKKSGRSLSQEIETRLRRTFREEEELAKRFGSHEAGRVFQTIAQTLNLMRNPKNPDADWLHDPYAFQLAADAINATLYLVRPKEATNPFLVAGLMDAWDATTEVWRDIANSDSKLPLNNDLSFKQWFARYLKSTIPEIVERAGERANVAQRRPDDDHLTTEQQIALVQLIQSDRVKK